MEDEATRMIYVCSDSVGETADKVAQAMIRQFDMTQVKVKRFGHVKTEAEICAILAEVKENRGFIAYTLVQPELREIIKEEAMSLGVRAVDIMGPMMQAFVDTFNDLPKSKPGLLHELNDDYFKRVEAVEFAVKCDDGRDPRSFLAANVVLIGVSRTSKTPLSIFLAHKGLKVANLPLVPEVKPPKELYQIPANRIVGLTMNTGHLLKIRMERLKTVGLSQGAMYANMERIYQELNYAENLMKELGCRVINVTDKAIEETAGIIMGYMQS